MKSRKRVLTVSVSAEPMDLVGADIIEAIPTDAVVPVCVDVIVPVTLIERCGDTALVQWQDGATPRRLRLPFSEVESGRCAIGVLRQGVAASVDWAVLWRPLYGPDAVAQELYRRNVWTVEDFEKAAGPLQRAVSGLAIHELMRMYEEARNADH